MRSRTRIAAFAGREIAAYERAGQGGVDRFTQLGAANLGQVGDGDAHNESGFHAFAQGYDEGFEHAAGVPVILKMNFNFNYIG